MNIVFTIVAKNYLPLAFVQANQLKLQNPEVEHRILLCDTAEGLDLNNIPYRIDTLDILGLKDIQSLAFKYNITEFCTAVKPYYFDYLFSEGYQKAIYLDPDVCPFSSVTPVFNELDNKSIVVTPHFITPEVEYTGTITEALLLHVGIFNFGFAAASASAQGRLFIKWWANRLHNLAYQDKIEALHTDQKWADLLPAFFGDDLLISKDIGRNMAFWNLHERKLKESNGKYLVENRFTSEKMPLMLFHFAGYDINNVENIVHKHHPEYSMSEFSELLPLFQWYKQELFKNHFNQYITLPYAYGQFDNGDNISVFQRRLFRILGDGKSEFSNPFKTGKDTFHQLLKGNKLLAAANVDKMKNSEVDKFAGKIKILNMLMSKVKALLGFDKYSLLLKFCQRYFRPENQTFLIKEFNKNYKFVNENQKVRS